MIPRAGTIPRRRGEGEAYSRGPLAEGKVRMGKWLVPAAVLAASVGGQEPQNPDLKHLPQWGLSVLRPPKPKNEEWEFKETGFRFSCPLSVVHKVDEVGVDFLVREPAPGLTFYDPKESLEALFGVLSNSPHFREVRKRAPVRSSRLPGGGAGNVPAWYLEVDLKDEEGKPFEFRIWCFIGRESRCLYTVVVITGEKMYAKYQKELTYILSSIRIHRLPK